MLPKTYQLKGFVYYLYSTLNKAILISVLYPE